MRDILKGAALGVMGCSIWLIPGMWQVLPQEAKNALGSAVAIAAPLVLGVVAHVAARGR